jgi:hypothetical protein
MMNFIESSAGRIAAQIQGMGRYFDPEVLSLPGGSVIAVVLLAYSSAILSVRRLARRRAKPMAACAGCFGHN